MTRARFKALIAQIDFAVLLSVLSLIAIGLASIYSATNNSPAVIHFQKQVFWVAIGVPLLILVAIAPKRFYHYGAYIFYFVGLGLLVLVFLFGKKVSGNAGWFGIGSFGIQPAEFVKIGVILALARYMSDPGVRLSSIRDVGISLMIVLIPWLLIVLQPDFGTGMIYIALFVPMLFLAGAEMFILLVIISPVIIAVLALFNYWYYFFATILIVGIFYYLRREAKVAIVFFTINMLIGTGTSYLYRHLPDYQKKRIAVFIDPTKDPQAAGYNVIQSKVAIGSGGVTGKGFLKGSQTQLRFIPEQWTDFIYCVPAEEWGFVGAGGVLLLFAVLFWRGMSIAANHDSRFSSLVCIGIVATFVTHTFINVGMTLGVIPVIGLPLPFMSYGGSSFLTSMVMAGILLHAYAHRTSAE